MGSGILCVELSVGALGIALTACGDNAAAPSGSAGSAANGGASPAAGGAAADSAKGGSATGGASGASTGSAGFPPCPAGSMTYGPGDIDLTLAGLNADLPSPSKDCLLAAPSSSMCAALTVEVKGAQREVVCTQPSSSASNGSSLHCTNATDAVSITTGSFGGKTAPATFALSADTLPNPLELTLPEGTFGRFDDPAATAAQVNGWVNLFFDAYGCNNTMYGVIAVTLPDTGSGVLRARGSFQARQFFH